MPISQCNCPNLLIVQLTNSPNALQAQKPNVPNVLGLSSWRLSKSASIWLFLLFGWLLTFHACSVWHSLWLLRYLAILCFCLIQPTGHPLVTFPIQSTIEILFQNTFYDMTSWQHGMTFSNFSIIHSQFWSIMFLAWSQTTGLSQIGVLINEIFW